MLRLTVRLPNKPLKTGNWDKDVLTLGRAASNDIQVNADNVSGQHARILFEAGECVLRDMHSTNGTLVERGAERFLLHCEALEMAITAGDRIGLASMENLIVVDEVQVPASEEVDE